MCCLGLQDKDATVRIRALSSIQGLADGLWEAVVLAPNTCDGGCIIAQLAPILADRRGPHVLDSTRVRETS